MNLNDKHVSHRGTIMKLNFSGHHVVVTDAIAQFTTDKLAKISKHFPQITFANVVITVDKQIQKIDVTTQYEGCTIKVTASDKQLYSAISTVVKKLESSLTKKKGTMIKNLHRKYTVEQSNMNDAA